MKCYQAFYDNDDDVSINKVGNTEDFMDNPLKYTILIEVNDLMKDENTSRNVEITPKLMLQPLKNKRNKTEEHK